MAKRKKTNSKKPTIKIPARPELKTALADVKVPSDEPLVFPDSPAPYINDAQRTGHLSKADWSTKNPVEVDELESEQEEEPNHGSDQFAEITEKDSHAASGTALTFVNVDSESFKANPSQKRKRDSDPDFALADENLPGSSVKKFIGNRFIPQGITDAQVDRILGGKQKKSTGKGKARKDTDRDDTSMGRGTGRKKPGKAAKTPTITFISKGPFKMDTSKTFEMFKRGVAEVLPCRTSMLPVAKFEWKFDNQAQSAPHKKIANRAGYEALIDAINAKRVADNVVVWLYTPKPAKDEEDWDTGNPDHIEEPFDFDQEADSGSHKSLISDMATKRRLAEEELQKEYPLGRYAKFPYKRVWHNDRNDTYFELTPAAGKADKSAPPLLAHFADDKKLKVPSCVPPPPNAPPAAFGQYYQQRQEEVAQALAPHVPPQAGPPPFPIPGGFPPPNPPYGYQPYFASPYMPAPYMGGYPYPLPYGPAPHQQPFTDPAETLSASSSPSITTSHDVSLSEFCTKYRISDGDQAKLAALEYQPGNRAVKTLEEKEWRDIGQFTKVGWQFFIAFA
ncbi:hypothetical protein EV702DRAFT_1204397 [Suillus placidus]|uniref:Uncharacterized protein n=1 Tax=Suillus placidus TaxID=48579 RepID=A0A9P7CW61_9AGAM|nr:hypothetical protein EV702DRAFT_1204397 [Suillus placidus]